MYDITIIENADELLRCTNPRPMAAGEVDQYPHITKARLLISSKRGITLHVDDEDVQTSPVDAYEVLEKICKENGIEVEFDRVMEELRNIVPDPDVGIKSKIKNSCHE